MKKYNNFDSHMVLLGIIIPFLVFFISMNSTFAYFTATATKQQSAGQTASVQITFKTNGVSTVTATTKSGNVKIIPGDTLSIGGTITNSGTTDAYVLIKYVLRIQKAGTSYIETKEKKYLVFDEQKNLVNVETNGILDTTQFAKIISSTANQNSIDFTGDEQLTHSFEGQKYDNSYKNAKVEYELCAYAIQTSHITQQEATEQLLQNAGYYSTKVYGNSYQAVGTGKNLLNPQNNVVGSLVVADGTINPIKYVTTSDFISLTSGTYTISYKSGVNLRYVAMFNQNKEIIGNAWSNRANPYTFTVNSDCLIRIDMEKEGNITIDRIDTFFSEHQVQIEKGSTATEYEPYTGGVAAPTPTNPSQIQSVGELTKNFAHPNSIDQTANGITIVTNQDGSVSVNGVASQSVSTTLTWCGRNANGSYYHDYILNPGESVIQSVINAETGKMASLGIYCQWTGADSGKTYYGNSNTSDEAWMFDRLYSHRELVAGENMYKGTWFLQLELGSVATGYEPYGKYKIPVEVTNKNLFNVNNLISYADQVVNNGDGTLSIKRSSGSAGVSSSETLAKLAPGLQVGKTYTLSMKTTFIDKRTDTVWLGTSKYSWKSGTAKTITQEDLDSRVFWYASENDTTVVSIVYDIQIEAGATATEYVPHVEPFNIYLDEPLRKVGDVADYVDLETGTVVRMVGEYMFTGSETWRLETSSSEFIACYTSKLSSVKAKGVDVLSNYFVMGKSATSPINSIWGRNNNSAVSITISLEYLTESTETALQNLILQWYKNGKPLIVQYQLATPYTETIVAPGINMKNHSIVSIGTTIQPSK